MIYPWQTDDWNRLQQLRPQWPHALLLHGQAGIGKLQFAQHLAQGFLCEAPQSNGEPCGTCAACTWFAQGNHPDYRIVLPEALAGEAPGAADDAKPASTNVPRAEYPKVHADGRVSFRLKAPDAKKVQLQPGGADNGLGKGPIDMARGADGTWAVTIRCAEISPDRRSARLVAGGGIVAESDPLAELAETQAKFQAMLSAIVRA